MSCGTLYICATPIGNREDISARAVRILKEVDLIAAEDTRHSRGLLDFYGISKPLVSYHEHNKYERAEELVGRMLQGKNVALISDAGTPVGSRRGPGDHGPGSGHPGDVPARSLRADHGADPVRDLRPAVRFRGFSAHGKQGPESRAGRAAG